MWPRHRYPKHGIYPWQRGNSVRLLVDGRQFFPAMLEEIRHARHSVELELYLLEEGQCMTRLSQALIEAVQHGASVRCLFDGFGSRGLRSETLDNLRRHGVQLQIFNPLKWPLHLGSLRRDHRKLLIVDNRRAWVGGTGATDQFWNPDPAGSEWHELMVEQAGPVVQDWRSLFEHEWLGRKTRPPVQASHLPAEVTRQGGARGMARVAYAETAERRDILKSLLDRIRHARRRVWLSTPYFLPTGAVRVALARAALRGVDVRLLLTGRETDSPAIRYAGQRFYPRLLRCGVQIHEYQPRFLHCKAVLVDDWCSIGSCNFDRWTLHFNREANLESVDPGLCLALAGQLESDFAESRHITLQDWQARSRKQRLYQWFWGRFDRLAVYLLGAPR